MYRTLCSLLVLLGLMFLICGCDSPPEKPDAVKDHLDAKSLEAMKNPPPGVPGPPPGKSAPPGAPPGASLPSSGNTGK